MIFVSGTVFAKAVRGMEETFDTLSKDLRIPHFFKRNSLRECYLKSPHPDPPLEGRGLKGNLHMYNKT